MMFNQLTLATVAAFALKSTAADSIYDTAKGSANFTTLTTAIDAAGLKETLSGAGTFTVFAPTDTAFAKVDADLLTKFLEPTWLPQLQDVLRYHVLGTEVFASDLKDGMTVPTLNSENITINLDPPRVNGNSNILVGDGLADLKVDNGVIHGIDSVLTPTSVTSNIVDIAVGNDAFKTLVTAVTEAGLVDALSGDGPLTVFAPTDEAFAALPNGTLEELLKPENKDKLTEILKYHAVSANALSSSLKSGKVTTLNGDAVEVKVSDAGVMINDANVVKADVIASNGIIHVIDKVLLPPADGDNTTTKKPTKTPPAASGAAVRGITMAAGVLAAVGVTFA
eukprot:CAMPEP_0172536318 /NCGR_PEP_ID=MMETSP1067-20121228/8099_1 /TAXON_ID=265564 ORGANISM="Thalassiosira punctigera, Strain Tpunct2005C2" /NCGR_SAMPLE_ID=MMETSP1067 /ASSEMBLY_ACC=CAM_ASM_000444 /LENGTH=337 /DNA_ID=CAMNT_0013321369 /DNA_START=176 /DNA_END=1189 /DNA_ORIENTATION=+